MKVKQKKYIAIISFTIILLLGFLSNGVSTGYIVYTQKSDISVEKILAHGVDAETNEMYVYYYIKNSGDYSLAKGTEISTRIRVRYIAPPVTSSGSSGSISLAEVFFEEATATYILQEDLKQGKTILVASPQIPILLSTVRFFEKYKIKNKITIELDSSRKIQETNEKNNKYTKWYYMQKLDEPEDAALEPY